MIVEFKGKNKNTLIGKVGKFLLNRIRTVRFYCRLIYYRISPSSYHSHESNNSDMQSKILGATFHYPSNDEYEQKRSFFWGKNFDDNNELTLKYNELLTKILSYSHSHPHATVLELGAYDGMWTQYFLEAEKIICVDLFKAGFATIKEYEIHIDILPHGVIVEGVK